MDVLQLLEGSSLFAALNKNILWRIGNLTEEIEFAAGQYLIHQGEEADFCYLISQGRVQVRLEPAGEPPVIINEIGQGEILGELSLIDELPRSASVVAIDHVHTFAISAWDFKAQLQAYPEIALQLLPVIAKRLRQTQDQLWRLNK
jgi:CRP/FNR family transcriptional regulator, cyclic AMP receptor protein